MPSSSNAELGISMPSFVTTIKIFVKLLIVKMQGAYNFCISTNMV